MNRHTPASPSTSTRPRRAAGVFLVLSVTAGCVAFAAPAHATTYPSWSDVQSAQASQAATAAEISTLNGTILALQKSADSTGDAALGAGERYQTALIAQQTAQQHVADLTAETDAAQKKATESSRRVGELIAQLSRTGSDTSAVSMLANSKKAGNLLYQLGTMTNLTQRTQGLVAAAKQDANVVSSLGDQARAAQTALAQRTTDASAALKTANSLAASSQAAVSAQETNSTQLYSQLAFLKGTTAATEASYYTGLAAGTAAQAAKAAAAAPKTPTKAAGLTGTSTAASGSTSTGTTSGSSGAAPVKTVPVTSPVKTAPVTTPVKSNPVTPPVTVPVAPVTTPTGGTTAAAATAMAFARAQVGKPYIFDAAGPSSYDCSGLMMASYAAAGVGIGGHSVRYQYNYLAAEGRIVSIAARQPGDILFYYSNSDGMYHDAMYLGGGMMVEAPKPGTNVRIVAIRFTDLSYVGRPTG